MKGTLCRFTAFRLDRDPPLASVQVLATAAATTIISQHTAARGDAGSAKNRVIHHGVAEMHPFVAADPSSRFFQTRPPSGPLQTPPFSPDTSLVPSLHSHIT
jgi:hypothetical protein